MYRAKTDGKALLCPVRFRHAPPGGGCTRHGKQPARRSIDRQAFVLHYQPVIRAEDQARIAAFWRPCSAIYRDPRPDPAHGVHPPGRGNRSHPARRPLGLA